MKQEVADLPLSWRHIWIVFVASLGQLVGTGVATIAGILIPMINIIQHPELSSVMQGVIGASDLLGIVVGSVLFGRLSDKYGYLFWFRFCPILILVASVVAIFIPSIPVLTICLFIIGLGIGGEYSLDSGYISELLPARYRSLMIGVAKTASAIGNIAVAGFSYLLIMHWMDAARWSELMWIVAVIAIIMLVCRIWFYQSPKWLMLHGREDEAELAVREFLGPEAEVEPEPSPSESEANPASSANVSIFRFVKENFDKVMLTGLPWACEGLGVYGIGVFLPILVMALGIGHDDPSAAPIIHVAASVHITFLISCIILPGFILGLYLINKRKPLPIIQSGGFWLCAVAMILLLLAFCLHWHKWVSIIAFMAFELFLNMGPHLVTYVLPPDVFPAAQRATGSGLAASIGKVGAVVGVFFIPVLLGWGGPLLVLGVSAAVMAIGAVSTTYFAKKLGVKN